MSCLFVFTIKKKSNIGIFCLCSPLTLGEMSETCFLVIVVLARKIESIAQESKRATLNDVSPPN